MKTYYFIKSILPYLFLPLAPGVVQMELTRQGFLSGDHSALLGFFMQVIFTLGIVVFVGRAIRRKNEAKNKAFLRMSCVSKKVYHQGEWISVERYLADHHNIVVSHGMTPEEYETWMRESEEYLREPHLEVAASVTLDAPPVLRTSVFVAK